MFAVQRHELGPRRAGRVVLADAAVLEAHDLAADVGFEDLEVEGRRRRRARDLPDLELVGALVVEGDVVGDGDVAVVVGAQKVCFVDTLVVRGCEADSGFLKRWLVEIAGICFLNRDVRT